MSTPLSKQGSSSELSINKDMKNMERLAWVLIVLTIAAWGATRGRSSGETSDRKTSWAQDSLDDSETTFTKSGDRSRERTTDRQNTNRSSTTSLSLAALHSSDPLQRLSGFLKVLASSTPESLEQVTAALDQLKASGISLPVEEDLLNFRAGQLNGAKLMADHVGSADDLAMITSLKRQYEGWLQTDPHAAGQWLDGLPSGKYRDQMAVIYIAACTKEDPVGSLHLVSSLHPSQQAAAAKAAAGKLVGSTSGEEISGLLRTMGASSTSSESRYLNAIFDSLIGESTRDGGQLASSLVEDHLDEAYVTGSTLQRLSTEKAKADPVAALEWAIGMEGRKSDLPSGAMIQSAVGAMTREGLDSVKIWADAHSGQQGIEWVESLIERRQAILEERGQDENEYDRDD